MYRKGNAFTLTTQDIPFIMDIMERACKALQAKASHAVVKKAGFAFEQEPSRSAIRTAIDDAVEWLQLGKDVPADTSELVRTFFSQFGPSTADQHLATLIATVTEKILKLRQDHCDKVNFERDCESMHEFNTAEEATEEIQLRILNGSQSKLSKAAYRTWRKVDYMAEAITRLESYDADKMHVAKLEEAWGGTLDFRKLVACNVAVNVLFGPTKGSQSRRDVVLAAEGSQLKTLGVSFECEPKLHLLMRKMCEQPTTVLAEVA